MATAKPTRDQLREAARVKAKAMRESQKKGEARKKAIIISSSVVALVAVVVTIALSWSSIFPANSISNKTPTVAFANGGVTITKGLAVATSASQLDKATPTIIIYEDLQCPACRAFEATNMPQITELVKAGKYNLEIHPIGMLDGFSPNEYASRAASALMCVAEGAPDRFLDYNTGLYNGQPAENTAGPENSILAKLAQQLGVSDLGVESCIKNSDYSNWVKNQVPSNRGEITGTTVNFTGTPTVIVNNQKYEGDLVNGAMFLQWLQTVAPVTQ